jgi:hypothetical protein
MHPNLAVFAGRGTRGGQPCCTSTFQQIHQTTPVSYGPNTAYAWPVLLAGTQDGSVVALRMDTGAVVWHWGSHQSVDTLVRTADMVYVTSHPTPATTSKTDPLTRLTALRERDISAA